MNAFKHFLDMFRIDRYLRVQSHHNQCYRTKHAVNRLAIIDVQLASPQIRERNIKFTRFLVARGTGTVHTGRPAAVEDSDPMGS